MENRSDIFMEKIKSKLSSDELKTSMIVTLLGCSGVLAEFIADNFTPKDVPIEVQYSVALTAGNIMALIHDRGELSPLDFSKDYKMSEQTQERIHRVMKKVIYMLYEQLKSEENEFNSSS